MHIEPYLFFEGRCEEALEFYRVALGAEVEVLMRFSDSPEPETLRTMPPGTEQKVMHASFRIGDSRIMASDGECQGGTPVSGVTLSLSASDAAEAERLFTALGEGGAVQMPLTETFFSPRFGMLTDRFGVRWMVGVN